MNIVLITGITGVIGSHLADYVCRKRDVELHGVYRRTSALENLKGCRNRVCLHYAELRDAYAWTAIINRVRPAWIFHMAAQTYVDTSFDSPGDTFITNIIGTTNILNAVRTARQCCPSYSPRILISSSSEVYGTPDRPNQRMHEGLPFRPPNPYAVSKVGEEMVAFQFHKSYGLQTIRARFFTQTGPRRDPRFVEGKVARTIAEIENRTHSGPIIVGNVKPSRTWCDVRDGAVACWLLLEKGTPGEAYNVAGASEKNLENVLKFLSKLSSKKVSWRSDQSLFRPTDILRQRASITKIRRATGWKPSITFETTMRDLLTYHRELVNVQARDKVV